MNNSLEKKRHIRPESLNTEFYFESLLTAAQAAGILALQEIERIRYECISLLACKVERYNAGDSTSLPVEKAQDIMASALYTVGVFLKTAEHPDDAVRLLKTLSINELYRKGRARIDTLMSATKNLHKRLLEMLVPCENVFYRETLDAGIKGFFKLYNPDYSAQEIHITADYPMCDPPRDLAGIEFIKAYVNAAYAENMFCDMFDPDDLHFLLKAYEPDYENLLMNIFQPALTAALGCVIAGGNLRELDVTRAGAVYLADLFSDMPEKNLRETLSDAAKKLFDMSEFAPSTEKYVLKCLPRIVSDIKTAAENSSLDRVFVVPAGQEEPSKINFDFGEKIDDELYRELIDLLSDCESFEQKKAAVKSYIHSLADMEDVLCDAYFTGEEISELLGELSLPEIAALSARHPANSEYDDQPNEREKLFREYLGLFITRLPPHEREAVLRAAKMMQEG